MKQSIVVVLLLLPTISHTIDKKDTTGNPFFSIRPQGSNTIRDVMYYLHHVHSKSFEGFGANYLTTIQYSLSNAPDKLAQYLFFNGTRRMDFGDIGTESVDVFARNFLLNDDFQGRVRIEPTIENFMLNLKLYFDVDKLVEGWYFSIEAPLTWSKWNIGLEEVITTSGTEVAANALGNPAAISSPIPNITQAWTGDTINEFVFPDIQEKLGFARLNGPRSTAALAHLQLLVGYSTITIDTVHADLEAFINIPTGTRPEATFFFEPIIGTGKHLQIGIGMNAHREIWDNQAGKQLDLHSTVRASHFVSTRQHRTFDIKGNGIGSRFLLLKRFEADGNYAGEIVFGPNVTTRLVRSSVSIVFDSTSFLAYTNKEFMFDLGYNFWYRSRERLKIIDEIKKNTFGIQGNTPTAGPDRNRTASRTRVDGQNANDFDPFDQPVFLNTTDLDDMLAKSPRGISYTLFINMHKVWFDHPHDPFLILGASIEYPNNNNVLAQWSIWSQLGFSW